MGETSKIILAKQCANYCSKDLSCGICGAPDADYSTPCIDGKEVCGLAYRGKQFPLTKENPHD